MIKVIAVGKLNQTYMNEGIVNYQKQLPVDLDIIEIKDEATPHGLSKEATRILSKIKPSDYVIVLAIKGEKTDSIGFAELIEHAQTYAQGDIVFVIGGSYGLDPSVDKRANKHISFSDLTFPHQLMRLILIEQIYRGFMIMKNHPYHK